MATLLLTHGAFQGGWVWQKTAPLLRARGHAVHTPTLPGCGYLARTVRPEDDLNGSIQDMINYLDMEDLKDVVIVGHSFSGLICGALAADCAPILLADPVARVVAAAHAGWKGALGGVIPSTVAQMERLGARRDRILAAVGPCIGPASYEVGLEFLDRFVEADAANGRFFSPGATPDKRQFDLPAFVLAQLAAAGVEQREWVGRDTCAEPDHFFSNRRAFQQGEGDYGRLLSAIVL